MFQFSHQYIVFLGNVNPLPHSPAAKQSKLVGLRKVVVEPSNLVCSLLISIEFNSVEEPIRKMMRNVLKRPLKIAIQRRYFHSFSINFVFTTYFNWQNMPIYLFKCVNIVVQSYIKCRQINSDLIEYRNYIHLGRYKLY